MGGWGGPYAAGEVLGDVHEGATCARRRIGAQAVEVEDGEGEVSSKRCEGDGAIGVVDIGENDAASVAYGVEAGCVERAGASPKEDIGAMVFRLGRDCG